MKQRKRPAAKIGVHSRDDLECQVAIRDSVVNGRYRDAGEVESQSKDRGNVLVNGPRK